MYRIINAPPDLGGAVRWVVQEAVASGWQARGWFARIEEAQRFVLDGGGVVVP